MHWLNGEKLQETCAAFDLRDRGLLLGDGVFDTSLVLNGEVVFKARHLDRLFSSCKFLGFEPDRSAVASTLDLAATDVGTGALRVTVTRGPGPRGLLPQSCTKPTVLISASPGSPVALWRPASVQISSVLRNETSVSSRHKCLAYLDTIHALRVAAKNGFDDAMFLNTERYVTCCSTSNLFVFLGKTLATPPVEDGVLPGVTRAMLLELAAQAGLSVIETSLDIDHVMSADAVFMSNSLRLISPVVSLESARLSTAGYADLAKLAHVLIAHVQNHHGACTLLTDNSADWLSTV